MGEVYRARDTKLQRDVAIKILPGLFASDPERRARFGRDAQVLASLNHPNIAQIYGVEESDGAPALVMDDSPAHSPTITNLDTRVGTLLGTAAYMAPEQVKGRAADPRADVWSFGAVLYELLTGVAPFRGDGTSEILARVIERDPDCHGRRAD